MKELNVVNNCSCKGLLNVSEAAKFLNIPKSTVYQMCMKKQLQYVKIGRANRFRKSDLEKYIENNVIEVGEFD